MKSSKTKDISQPALDNLKPAGLLFEHYPKPYVNRFCISLYSKTNTIKESGEVADLLQSLDGIFKKESDAAFENCLVYKPDIFNLLGKWGHFELFIRAVFYRALF